MNQSTDHRGKRNKARRYFFMGKGDKKTKKGKIFRGSHGRTRPKKKAKEKKK